MAPRTLAPGQRSLVHVHDAVTGDDVVVHESTEVLFEAPNWTLDGASLLINGDGLLWSLTPEAGSTPEPVAYEGLPELNNDHVLAPDGATIYLSSMDRHIYRGRIGGGPVERVTSDEGVWHFLHGVSPDGEQLAYVRILRFEDGGRLAIMSSAGGESVVVDTGEGRIDGPEWTPDGAFIHLNSENWADRPGHAQIARMPAGGGALERLVVSDTVDWFPHLAPDARTAVYISFPTGTEGHPADLPVALVVVSTDDWSSSRERIELFGGQGTINVNSWAPDSRRFAYVSYPVDA